MSGFINNVAMLFVRHYTEYRTAHLMIFAATFALPLILALLMQESAIAYSTSSTVLLFACVGAIICSMQSMHKRERFVVEHTLPVSTAERYSFLLLNSVVASLVLCFCALHPALAVAEHLYPLEESLSWVDFYANYGTLRRWTGIFSTEAVVFLVCLNHRMKPAAGVAVALLAVFVVQLLIQGIFRSQPHLIDDVKMWGNILFIVGAWIAGYFLLKKYEFKL